MKKKQKEIIFSELEVEITFKTLDKIINSLPEDSLTRGLIDIARSSMDDLLKPTSK